MSFKGKMFVVKRNGRKETIDFGKIIARIENQCTGLDMDWMDPCRVMIRIICCIDSGITTVELDNLAAEAAVSMMTIHQDYAILGARIAISSLYKSTKEKFSDVMADLYNIVDPSTKKKVPIISDNCHRIVQKHSEIFNSVINHNRDFRYDYFGFKTLENGYLLKIGGTVVERPQHMLLRVSIGIHGDDIEKVIETYELLSEGYFIHASPTLRAACTVKPQMSSCFTMTMVDDSIEGVCATMRKCALISKYSGGTGLNVHSIRAKDTSIACLDQSTGVVPILRCFDQIASYVNQGGSGRAGAFAAYIEPWHADIFEFLNLKKSTDEERGARHFFPALWICDIFMQRVSDNEEWSLMCPLESPGLADVWGKKFNDLYTKYEKEGRYKSRIRARDLWSMILAAQIETGTPHILHKDHCNKKSNQQHIGTIKCGSLSTEIVQFSNTDEIGICVLASIAVNMFVNVATRTFDFERMRQVATIVTRNLDKIIETNYYPISEMDRYNRRHRPIAIGIQGLADAFILMRYPFESEEAQKLNIQIFETLYYATLDASADLAEAKGTHPSHEGSPASKGILQYDMWNVKPTDLWDWSLLKEKIADSGLRNSLLIAVMPTVATSNILGNNNSIEPYTSNVHARRVNSSEFYSVNPHLFKDLVERNLWNEEMEREIIVNNGSIQQIDAIPSDLKKLYKTVWEISHDIILKMASERAPYIDHSQSLNIHMAKPSEEELSLMHFKGWRMGLKTGSYYLRTKPATKILQFNGEESIRKRVKTTTSTDS